MASIGSCVDLWADERACVLAAQHGDALAARILARQHGIGAQLAVAQRRDLTEGVLHGLSLSRYPEVLLAVLDRDHLGADVVAETVGQLGVVTGSLVANPMRSPARRAFITGYTSHRAPD